MANMWNKVIACCVIIGICSVYSYAQSTVESCSPADNACTFDRIEAAVNNINSNVIDVKSLVKQENKIQNKYCQITYGSCFILVLEKRTWYSAKHYCEERNGHLAEIYDAQLNVIVSFVRDEIGQTLWLGGSDEDVEGQWVWVNSSVPIRYSDWDAGQPTNGITEYCLSSGRYPDRNGHITTGWHDATCTDMNMFLCEYPLP